MDFLPEVASRWAARAWWYPTVGFSRLSGIFAPKPWFNTIDDCVILGAAPFARRLVALVETERISAVVRPRFIASAS